MTDSTLDELARIGFGAGGPPANGHAQVEPPRHADDPGPPEPGQPAGPPRTPEQEHADRVHNELARIRARAEATETFNAERESTTPPPPPRTMRDVIANPRTPTRQRIRGVMATVAFVTVVAKRKTGKTTLLGPLLDALLAGPGAAFLGNPDWEVIEDLPGDVLLLSYEMTEEEIAALFDAQGLGEFADRIHLWGLRGYSNPLAHLTSPAGAQDLQGRLDGIALVVIDTFGQAFSGESDDDNAAVRAWLAAVSRLVGPTRSVVMTVHAGWGGTRSRGASALEDHPTTILTLTVDDDDNRYLSVVGRPGVDRVNEMPLRFDPARQLVSLAIGAPSRREAASSAARKASRDDARAAEKAADDRVILRAMAAADGPEGARRVAARCPGSWTRERAQQALDRLAVKDPPQAVRVSATKGWELTASGRSAAETDS